MKNSGTLLLSSDSAGAFTAWLDPARINQIGRRLSCAMLLVVLGLTAGCAGTKQYVGIASGVERQPSDANRVRIYLMRPTVQGAAVSVEIQEGKEIIGKVGSHGHLCWEREPGEVRIIETKYTYLPLKFQAAKGGTYYIAWESSLFSAGPRMRLLSEQEGVEMLRKCSRKPKASTRKT
jgi:hypothetical protein